ncbi:TPA: Potassium transporter, variant 3 [Trebouxia sp. C0005]
MSIIFWAMTLILLVKYQLIVLNADDHGEGGTFALYSLLCRFIGINPGLKGKPTADDLSLLRYSTSRGQYARQGIAAGPAPKKTLLRRMGTGDTIAPALRKLFRSSRVAQTLLLLLVLMMTAMVIGDGVLTPAQTVLGAFGAISVKAPSFPQSSIAGISMGVLALLFAVQPLGSQYLGDVYAPILLLWFLLQIVVGIHNIAVFAPWIGKAINPYYLYRFFTSGVSADLAWRSTATIFLCITGAEASYADMGHFTRKSIRIAFVGILYPSVMISYFGQSAWLIKNPGSYATSFFASIPWGHGFFYFYFVVTVLAACVASQTMISAAYSIVRQSMALRCFPRMKVIHTSTKVAGQIWIPAVTVFIGAFTIAAVGIFQNSIALGFSYGVCVSTLMMGTDLLIALTMIVVWELPLICPILFLLFFGFIDSIFWTANLTKIPLGGWFAVAVAASVCLFSYIWFLGTSLKRQYAVEHEENYSDVMSPRSQPAQLAPALSTIYQNVQAGYDLTRLPGLGLFYSEQNDERHCPTVLAKFVRRLNALPELSAIVTVRSVPVSSVSPQERLLLRDVPNCPGVVQCIVRYGYQDKVSQGDTFLAALLKEVDRQGALDINSLCQDRVMYVILSSKLSGDRRGNPTVASVLKAGFVNWVYAPLAQILSISVSENWDLPQDRTLQMGVSLAI